MSKEDLNVEVTTETEPLTLEEKAHQAFLESSEGLRRSSFSQLSSYISCGEAFRLKRIVRPKVPERPAPWLTMGLAVHEACEKWEKSHRQSDMLVDYVKAYGRIQTEQLEAQPDLSMWINPMRGKNVIEALDSYKEKGYAQIEAYLHWHSSPENEIHPIYDPEDGEVWVEVPFEIMLGNIPVVGFIDIVDESNRPIDLKTGSKAYTRDLQLGLYKVALEKQYGLISEAGAFFYTKNDGRSVFGPTDSIDLTRYTEGYVTELFEAAERGIEAEVFLPNPQSICGICEVSEWCREKGPVNRAIPLAWESIPEEGRWWSVDYKEPVETETTHTEE